LLTCFAFGLDRICWFWWGFRIVWAEISAFCPTHATGSRPTRPFGFVASPRAGLPSANVPLSPGLAVESRRFLSLVAHAQHATDAGPSISPSMTKQRRRLVMSELAV
jgi:hypothetical protein